MAAHGSGTSGHNTRIIVHALQLERYEKCGYLTGCGRSLHDFVDGVFCILRRELGWFMDQFLDGVFHGLFFMRLIKEAVKKF